VQFVLMLPCFYLLFVFVVMWVTLDVKISA
jgi:hypothetical protein